MKINDVRLDNNEIMNIGVSDYLMGSEVDNKMDKIDNIFLDFNNIDKNIQ